MVHDWLVQGEPILHPNICTTHKPCWWAINPSGVFISTPMLIWGISWRCGCLARHLKLFQAMELANVISSWSSKQVLNVNVTKKGLENEQRKEGRKEGCRYIGTFKQQLKDDIVIGHLQITWIPTNAQGEITSLKGHWIRTIKEVAYNHLDLKLVNFRSHTTKQWEVIHAKLDGLFYYDPHLKDRMVENYMKEHLSLARNVWKKS